MPFISNEIKPFVNVFDKLAYTKSENEVFNDFLDISICALSAGAYEEEYLTVIKKYKKEEVNLLCELFAQMVMIMDNNGQGLKDCLGEFYQERISRGKHGQFFTPDHLCDAMAAMTISPSDCKKTIIDPCCGSGRMLLSAAKINRDNYFFSADIDHTCCKMTVINLCLNGLTGEVAWMNTLSGEHWGGYSILHACAPLRVPIIRKIAANEGIIINSSPFNRKEQEESKRQAPTNTITITQTKLDFE